MRLRKLAICRDTVPNRGRPEAVHLFGMFQRGADTADNLRELIRPSPDCNGPIRVYRLSVLRFFNEFFSAGKLPSIPQLRAAKVRWTAARRQALANPKTKRGRKRCLADEQIKLAREALESGSLLKDISRRLGVTKETLNRYGLHAKHFKPTRKKKLPRLPFSNWRTWSIH